MISEFDHDSIPRQCGVESPKVLPVVVEDSRMQSAIGFHASAYQIRLMLQRMVFIQKSERHAQSMFAEGFRAETPNFFLVARF